MLMSSVVLVFTIPANVLHFTVEGRNLFAMFENLVGFLEGSSNAPQDFLVQHTA